MAIKKPFTAPVMHAISLEGCPFTCGDAAAASDGTLAAFLTGPEFGRASALYRTDSDCVLREVAGETILVPSGHAARRINGMLTLNETYRFLWQCYMQPRTIGDGILMAGARYEAAPDRLESDVRQFVLQSAALGLICETKEDLT